MFIIEPNDINSFNRLCTIGLIEPNKHSYSDHEWLGKINSKGVILEKGVHEHIRLRFMREHKVSYRSESCLD